MNYIFILFAFLFLYNNSLQAQLVPGYMGKRHFLEVSGILGLNHFNARQAFMTKNAVNGTNSTTAFPLAVRPDITYNYVLSRKTIIRLGYTYSPFKISTSSYNSDPSLAYGADYQIYSNDFSIGFDFYPIKKRPQFLAPFGKYLRLGLHVVNTLGTPTNVFVENYGYANESISFTTVGVEIGTGYRTIIGDRFILSFNVQAILFPATTPVGNARLFYYSDRYHEQLAVALQERYVLGARLAIGVLL